MRLFATHSRRAALALGGMLSALALVPAAAAEAASPQVSLTVGLRWDLAGSAGTWTPYVVTVKDEGNSDLAGAVYLFPQQRDGTQAIGFPVYRAHLAVPKGGERSLLFYVIDAPAGYHAQLRDGQGRVLAQADPSFGQRETTAFGILSDLPQADQKIGVPLHALTRVGSALFRFPSAQSFPANAVYLSGLSGLIVDDFDTAALSQAQLQALRDFVGLGGVLIEAAGPSWRRTLPSLPADLVPLQPQATVTRSLSALLGLGGGRPAAPAAQVASGPLRAGRVALAAADGTPLAVELGYGAGRVIELAFDPLAEPFASQPELAALAWSQAISRGLSGVLGGSRPLVGIGFGKPGVIGPSGSFAGSSVPAAAPGIWAPGYGGASEQLYQLLTNAPAASVPPVGLLGGLLVAYVLLVGLLNYLFLKELRRQVLMWATIPAIAVAFTGAAYGVGLATRGLDFYVTEVQVQRLAPDGALETFTFADVYAPRRGDVRLLLPSNTLVSTAVSDALGGPSSAALVTLGNRPEVLLQQVPVWTGRPLQTLSVSHPSAGEGPPAAGLEAALELGGGRVRGTLWNRTPRPVRQLQLVTASGERAELADLLPPGARLEVDAALVPGAVAQPAPLVSGQPPSVRLSQESQRQAVLALAASQAVGGVGGSALVGLTDPVGSLEIDGARPRILQLAALAEPIQLGSSDGLASGRARARLVSTFGGQAQPEMDVYDLELPRGVTGRLMLNYWLLDEPSAGVHSVEVYDWSSQDWRPLPAWRPQPNQKGSQQQTPLGPSEVAGAVVRVRVLENGPNEAQLSVSER